MSRISSFFKKVSDWLFVGKRLPIIIVVFVIIAVSVTVAVVSKFYGEQPELSTIYVTIEGFGDRDFENKQIKIEDGDSVKDVFSLKYKKIYEEFGQPFIQYNEFSYFMGERKTVDKSFHVTIDGRFDSNLENAFLYDGQTLVISYY